LHTKEGELHENAETLLIGKYLRLIAFTAIASPLLPRRKTRRNTRRGQFTFIVGFTAGGGNDIIARIFGQKLSESLGQPVIIENKPVRRHRRHGIVAKSAPDGYTLLVGRQRHGHHPSVYAKLPYDSVRDFVAVSELASFPLILIVNPSSPIKSSRACRLRQGNPDKTN